LLVIHLLRKYLWWVDQKVIWFFKSYWYDLHLPLIINELINTWGLFADHALIINFVFVYLLFTSYIYFSIFIKLLLNAFLCLNDRLLFISPATLIFIYYIHLFLNLLHSLFLVRMILFLILFFIIFFFVRWYLFIFSFNR